MRLLLENWWLILSSLLLGSALWAAERAIDIEGQCDQMIAEAQEKSSALDKQLSDLATKMDNRKNLLEMANIAADMIKLQKQQNQLLQQALRKRQELDNERSRYEYYFMLAMVALMAWILAVASIRQLLHRRRRYRPRFSVRNPHATVEGPGERSDPESVNP
jgi:hypothetical protein